MTARTFQTPAAATTGRNAVDQIFFGLGRIHDMMALRRQRNALRVITRRPRNNAQRTLFTGELAQAVKGTAKLETSRALQALGLKEQLASGLLIESWTAH